MKATSKKTRINDEKTKEANQLNEDDLDSLLSISSGKNIKEAIKKEKAQIELLKLKINSTKRLSQLQQSRRVVKKLKTMVVNSVHFKNHLHLRNEELKDKFLLYDEIEENKILALQRHENDLASLISTMDSSVVRDAFIGKEPSVKQQPTIDFSNYFKLY